MHCNMKVNSFPSESNKGNGEFIAEDELAHERHGGDGNLTMECEEETWRRGGGVERGARLRH